jgi:hypothetical protein
MVTRKDRKTFLREPIWNFCEIIFHFYFKIIMMEFEKKNIIIGTYDHNGYLVLKLLVK